MLLCAQSIAGVWPRTELIPTLPHFCPPTPAKVEAVPLVVEGW